MRRGVIIFLLCFALFGCGVKKSVKNICEIKQDSLRIYKVRELNRFELSLTDVAIEELHTVFDSLGKKTSETKRKIILKQQDSVLTQESEKRETNSFSFSTVQLSEKQSRKVNRATMILYAFFAGLLFAATGFILLKLRK